jgi:hypothetical protein
MYNPKFDKQIKNFEKDLFKNRGNSCNPDVRSMPLLFYVLPENIELIPCVKNDEGELIPDANYLIEKEKLYHNNT